MRTVQKKSSMLCASALIVSGLFNGATAQQPTLTIATIETPPAAYKDPETKEARGLAVDKVRELAQKCGVNVEVSIKSAWSRAYEGTIEGKTDGIIPTTFTQERLALFDFSEPALFNFEISLLVPPSSEFTEFTGYDMLDGKVIGIRTGASMGQGIADYLATGKAEKMERVNSAGLARILFNKQADVLVDSAWSFPHHIGENRTKREMRVLQPALESSPQYLALSKNRNPAFAAGTEISNCLLGK